MAKASTGSTGDRPSHENLQRPTPTGGARVQGPAPSTPSIHPSQKSHMKDC